MKPNRKRIRNIVIYQKLFTSRYQPTKSTPRKKKPLKIPYSPPAIIPAQLFPLIPQSHIKVKKYSFFFTHLLF